VVRRLALVLLLIGAGRAGPAPAQPATPEVVAPIVYESDGGFYLGAGRRDGLTAGIEGTVRRGAVDVARVRVKSASSTSAFVEIVRLLGVERPRVGDRAVFSVAPPAPANEAEPATLPPPAGRREGGTADREFTPLLAPEARPALSRAANIFHGALRLGTNVNLNGQTDLDYFYHRAMFTGSVDRLFSGPYSVEWDLDLFYRDGEGYEGRSDYRDLRFRSDFFVVRRHFDDGSVIGAGRILPQALPAVGRLDGVYGEWQVSPSFRIGLAAGFRPDRDDLGFSTDEIGAAPYAVFESGSPDGLRFWSAAGFLATWFEGDADRQAVLWDGRIAWERLSCYWSSVVDLYGSNDEVRSGVRLTRLDANVRYDLHPLLMPWVGVRKWEVPESGAERSVVLGDEVFDDGYVRAYAGLAHDLGRGWSIDEQATWVVGSADVDGVQVRIGVRKSGVLGIPGSTFDVSAFNLVGVDVTGYSGSAGFGFYPVDSLWVRLGYVLTHSEQDVDGGPTFTNHLMSLDLDWRLSRSLTLTNRLAKSFGDETDAIMLDLALTWRW